MSHYDKIWWLEESQIGGMRQPELEQINDLYDNGLRAVISFLENLPEYND